MSILKESLGEHGLTLSDLPFQPTIESIAPIIRQQNGGLVVGYLFEDTHLSNPFEDWDGLGEILLANHKDGRLAIADALAFECSALDAASSQVVANFLTSNELLEAWLHYALSESEFKRHAQQKWTNQNGTPSPHFLKPYLRMVAYKEWQDAVDYDSYNPFHYFLDNFKFAEEMIEELWRDKLEMNEIGALGAIPLNINGYDGRASISSDYFDIQAVWLPSLDGEKRIRERSEVLAFGDIEKNSKGWTVILDPLASTLDSLFPEGKEPPVFDCSVEAINWLAKTVTEYKAALTVENYKEQMARGVNRAAHLEAQGDIELYNLWVTGEVYNICYVTYKKEDGKWKVINEDLCGGIFGTNYAIEELKSQFPKPIVEQPAKAA